MTEEQVKEVKKPDKEKVQKYKEEDYFDFGVKTVDYYNPETKRVEIRKEKETFVKPEYNTHIRKCKIRSAKAFDVSIEYLEKSYNEISGKKIDGIYATDLIDRYGFSDGTQKNRRFIADKYKFTSIRPVEIATEKLKNIINSGNIKKAYDKYLDEFRSEKDKEVVLSEMNI